jgi:RNA polymerase sigma factor (sigma-70 family)
VSATLSAALGRPPTIAELAAATGFDPDTLDTAGHAPLASASLNEPVRGAEGSAQLLDLVADAAAEDPEEELEKAARTAAVRDAVARLRERERDIVVNHFGLNGESHTLEEIASEMHLAPERVRQIERHAFAMLASKLDE